MQSWGSGWGSHKQGLLLHLDLVSPALMVYSEEQDRKIRHFCGFRGVEQLSGESQVHCDLVVHSGEL